MKKKKILKICLNLILIFFVSIVLGMTINSSVENAKIRDSIKDFKALGIYQESLSNDKEKFYKVSRETLDNETPSYTIKNGIMTYGGAGDIVVGMKTNVRNLPGITNNIEFFFGGHAASVCFEKNIGGYTYSSNESIECKPSTGVACVMNTFWNDENYQTEVICLRVKTSQQTKELAFEKMEKNIGKKYNKFYIFKLKNRFYCTDLISRAYEPFGIKLNYDGFYCSVQDLICSPYTDISFYKEYKKGINYYYYLG